MNSQSLPAAFEIEVFFDGECPLCRREIEYLKKRDKAARIRFTDLASADFSAAEVGKTTAELMAQIHGRLPNGQWLTGVEVFRRLYAAIGWKLLVRGSRLPILSWCLDRLYRQFAKRRLWLTGRSCRDTCRVSDSAAGNQ